jgi:hypothetical protein
VLRAAVDDPSYALLSRRLVDVVRADEVVAKGRVPVGPGTAVGRQVDDHILPFERRQDRLQVGYVALEVVFLGQPLGPVSGERRNLIALFQLLPNRRPDNTAETCHEHPLFGQR